MGFHFRITHTLDEATVERLDSALDLLGDILEELENLQMSFDDLKAAQDATDAKIDAVKADVAKIMESNAELVAKLAAIPPAGMTPEQEAALADATAHAVAQGEKLGAIDASVNPAPAAPAA